MSNGGNDDRSTYVIATDRQGQQRSASGERGAWFHERDVVLLGKVASMWPYRADERDGMVDLANRIAELLPGHMTTEDRIAELEQRVRTLEQEREARENYEWEQSEHL